MLRSITLTMQRLREIFTKGNCNICNSSLNTGALFTAECSHVFHFNCISNNLQNGSHECPTCQATWTQVQLPNPSSSPLHDPCFTFRTSSSPTVVDVDPNFNDDEPLPSSSKTQPPNQQDSGHGAMTVKTLPEYPALSSSDQSDSFAVLVGIRAPLLSSEATDMVNARAPLDLVAVLDVSGSMHGHNITLLKQAMKFVIRNLGPTDRLSIVTFSEKSQRIIPLKRMTEEGQADTIRAVDSIRVGGTTNIIAGLETAVKVLDQRRERNPVTSIILLSDGQDTDNRNFIKRLNRLPQSIRSNAKDTGERPASSAVVPVYTFGFGDDHDAEALHAISDGSGATFSFIGAVEVIQDAFARCLGGLLSVVAQEVEIQVHSGSPEVRIKSIPSGRYKNHIHSSGGRHGAVYIGDVYADEQKQFLVYLTVPQENTSSTTKLLEVKCSHKDPLSNNIIVSNTCIAEIRRPLTEELSEEDREICLEVDREENRISVAEGISLAQEMAERGELDGARSILERKRKAILNSYGGMKKDSATMSLVREACALSKCMQSRRSYSARGRSLAFSVKSSHMYQRAATQAPAASCGRSGIGGFAQRGGYGGHGKDIARRGGGARGRGGASGRGYASGCFSGGGRGGASVKYHSSSFEPSFTDALPEDTAFGFGGFETSYMQQMVKKSRIERQSDGQNIAIDGVSPANKP